MAGERLPYAVLVGLLLLGAYLYFIASRSREAELRQALRKHEIELQDAQQLLKYAARRHMGEVGRLENARRGMCSPPSSQSNRTMFREAKSSFARLFHPDWAQGDIREREIRAEIFKQFWAELERIERRA